MAYAYIWPPSLPQSPQKGFAETGGVLVLRTPMDAGPAKQRRRSQRAQGLQVTFLMTTAQTVTLETFVQNTLQGTARFGFTHPRLNTVVETRIVPQGDGQMYTFTYLAPGYWTVSLQLEILP
jgi:hypothetical protein